MALWSDFRANQMGSTTIEFVYLMPVVFSLSYGSIDMARILFQTTIVEKVLYNDLARHGRSGNLALPGDKWAEFLACKSLGFLSVSDIVSYSTTVYSSAADMAVLKNGLRLTGNNTSTGAPEDFVVYSVEFKRTFFLINNIIPNKRISLLVRNEPATSAGDVPEVISDSCYSGNRT